MRLDEQLRAMILRSNLSIYRLAKETGLDQAQIHRFKYGQRDIKLKTASTLAEYFGVELTWIRDDPWSDNY